MSAEAIVQERAAAPKLRLVQAPTATVSTLGFVGIVLLLVVYSYLAFVADKRGRHFFHDHPAIAWSYLGLWILSVGSGWALYAINYL